MMNLEDIPFKFYVITQFRDPSITQKRNIKISSIHDGVVLIKASSGHKHGNAHLFYQQRNSGGAWF
jgi:hypothetical protein